MTKTPIAIAATAAVGLSFAQPTLGQSDWSPTSVRYNGCHRSTRPPAAYREESGSNLAQFNGRNFDG